MFGSPTFQLGLALRRTSNLSNVHGLVLRLLSNPQCMLSWPIPFKTRCYLLHAIIFRRSLAAFGECRPSRAHPFSFRLPGAAAPGLGSFALRAGARRRLLLISNGHGVRNAIWKGDACQVEVENAWEELLDAVFAWDRFSGSLHSTSPPSGRSVFGRDDTGKYCEYK